MSRCVRCACTVNYVDSAIALTFILLEQLHGPLVQMVSESETLSQTRADYLHDYSSVNVKLLIQAEGSPDASN